MSFMNLSDIEENEIVPGFVAKFIHSEKMTFAFWTIEEGKSLPEHSHPHEQVACVLEGKFELCIDGEKKVLQNGDVAVIASNSPHSGRSLTSCRILDVFCPVREDYRKR